MMVCYSTPRELIQLKQEGKKCLQERKERIQKVRKFEACKIHKQIVHYRKNGFENKFICLWCKTVRRNMSSKASPILRELLNFRFP